MSGLLFGILGGIGGLVAALVAGWRLGAGKAKADSAVKESKANAEVLEKANEAHIARGAVTDGMPDNDPYRRD